MRADVVLDCKGDLHERLSGSPGFQQLTTTMTDASIPTHVVSGGAASAADRYLMAAETYRVSADMCDMVIHAAAQLDAEDIFAADLAPSGCGFVRFDKPLPVIDVRGETMLIQWALWGPAVWGMDQSGRGERAVVLWEWNDEWENPDDIALRDLTEYPVPFGSGLTKPLTDEEVERIGHIQGRWAAVGVSAIPDGQPLGPPTVPPPDIQRDRLLAEGMLAEDIKSGTNIPRYLHALWLLMEQTIAHVETEHPQRPARRRAERRQIKPSVTVVRLRRERATADHPHGEGSIDWAHRWLVRGHWRWQACGPNHPLAQEQEPGVWRARIWISPYVKGPEDAPFRITDKVYSLER